MNVHRQLCCLAMFLIFAGANAKAPSIGSVHGQQTMSVTARGKIASIDSQARMVTIQPEANLGAFSVHADEKEVRNFDQLRVGQLVVVDYHRSMAIDLQPAGSAQPGAYIDLQDARAPKDSLPDGSESRVVTVIAPIVAIDLDRHTVAVQGPRGNNQIVDVHNPSYQAVLRQLKKGDLVRIQFTEAVAVGIRPAE